MARILIADDHPLFLEAIQALLFRAIPDAVLLTATSVGEARRALGQEKVDLAIIDYSMPGMNACSAIREFMQDAPAMRLAVVSGVAEPADVMAALSAGASGFIPKTMPPGQIVSAVQLILSGGTYLPADVAIAAGTRTVPAQQTGARVDVESPDLGGLMTLREASVLAGIVAGKASKEIGRELGIREVTVKLHLRQIYKKLGATNRAEAAAIAVRRGLVPGTAA